VTVASQAQRRSATTGRDGRFTLLGLTPDTYTITVEASGYDAAAQPGVVVVPGATQRIAFRLVRTLQTIGSTRASVSAFPLASASDTFTVTGDARVRRARANRRRGLPTTRRVRCKAPSPRSPG